MSEFNFTSLSRIELQYLADKFEAIVRGTDKKAFADALVERKVTESDAKAALKERQQAILEKHPNHQPEVIKKDDEVLLIRMRRANPSFKYRAYQFTTQHPFVLMERGDADDLLRMESGFVLATPEEANEFYGRS